MGKTNEKVHKSYAANVSIALLIILLFSFIFWCLKKILSYRTLCICCGRNRDLEPNVRYNNMNNNELDDEIELMNRLDLNRPAANNQPQRANAPENNRRPWNIFQDDPEDGPWNHLQLLRQAQAMLPPQVRPQQENQHAGLHRQERPRTVAEIMLYQRTIADDSVWPREHFIPHVCDYTDEEFIAEASEWPHIPSIDRVREQPSTAEEPVQYARLRPALRDVAVQEYGGGDNNGLFLGNLNLPPSPHRLLGLGDMNIAIEQPILLPRPRGIRRNPRPAYYRRRNPHTRRYERVERRPPTPPPRNWMQEDPED